jgi:hypothetical protein
VLLREGGPEEKRSQTWTKPKPKEVLLPWRFVTYGNAATGTLVDDDATRRRFHRPGLLAQVWKRDPLAK